MPTKKKTTRRVPRLLNIRSKRHLAQRLRIPIDVLENVAHYAALHYNPTRTRVKKDSKALREIDAPQRLLKRIQRELGCSPNVARILTRLCTRNHHLPQGAPTSPALANLYLRISGVADRFAGLASQHHLNVTFFGDDILVSSDHPFSGLQHHMAQIVAQAGLRLHPDKTTALLGPDERHGALGIITNSRGVALDVPKSYRRHLRTLLFLCRRHGPGILSLRGISQRDPRRFLAGKIGFAVQINPKNAILFQQLDSIDWTRSTDAA